MLGFPVERIPDVDCEVSVVLSGRCDVVSGGGPCRVWVLLYGVLLMDRKYVVVVEVLVYAPGI